MDAVKTKRRRSAKIVLIRSGVEIMPPGVADPEVVKVAWRILQQARSGDINGLAYVTVYSDGACGQHHVGVVGMKTIGAVEMLKHDLVQNILKAP